MSRVFVNEKSENGENSQNSGGGKNIKTNRQPFHFRLAGNQIAKRAAGDKYSESDDAFADPVMVEIIFQKVLERRV